VGDGVRGRLGERGEAETCRRSTKAEKNRARGRGERRRWPMQGRKRNGAMERMEKMVEEEIRCVGPMSLFFSFKMGYP
jgi:hypothetical protein